MTRKEPRRVVAYEQRPTPHSFPAVGEEEEGRIPASLGAPRGAARRTPLFLRTGSEALMTRQGGRTFLCESMHMRGLPRQSLLRRAVRMQSTSRSTCQEASDEPLVRPPRALTPQSSPIDFGKSSRLALSGQSLLCPAFCIGFLPSRRRSLFQTSTRTDGLSRVSLTPAGF